MRSVRIEFVGDASGVVASVGDLNRQLDQLKAKQEQLSQVQFDPYSRSQAVRGLQEIAAAQGQVIRQATELSNLSGYNAGGQDLERQLQSRSEMIKAFTQNVTLGKLAFEDSQRREVEAIRSRNAEAQHQYDQETAGFARVAAAQRVAARDQIQSVKEYSREQSNASKEAAAFRDKIAPPAQTAIKFDVGQGKFVQEIKDANQQIEFQAVGLRHLIAIFDEYQRGQRGAMVASTTALARDTGLIYLAGDILKANPAWAAFAVAGVAAFGAIGVAIEQTYQKYESVKDIQKTIGLTGGSLGGATQQAAIAAEFRDAASATNEWNGVTRELYEQLMQLPAAARGTREIRDQFRDLATGLAGVSGDPSKSLKQYVDEARKGPEALAKFVTETLNLKNAVDGNGHSLEEQVQILSSTEAKYALIIQTVMRSRGAVLEAEKAARAASNSWFEWLGRLGAGIAAAEGSVEAGKALADAYEKIHNPLNTVISDGDKFTQAMRDQNAATEAGNVVLVQRVTNLNRIALAQEAVARTAGTDANAAAVSGLGNLQAQQTLRGQLTASEQLASQQELARINGRAQARKADLAAQTQAAREQLENQERLAAQRNPAGKVSEDPNVMQASNALEEAIRRQHDETITLDLSELQAKINNDAIGTQSRIDAANKRIEIIKKEVEAGRKGPVDIAQEEERLASLKRQLANKTFQEARDNARTEVELAKGTVEQINAAYEKVRAVATSTGQGPATFAQLQREQIRDLETAQSKAFTATTEFNSASERLGNIRTQMEVARLNQEVSAHKLSKAQAAVQEAQFTSTVMAEEEARVEAQLRTIGLTREQREKLYEHLAELYTKDAEKEIAAQEKITRAIEAENDKRVKSFEKVFDQIGGAGETLISSLISGTQTRQQAFVAFGKSVITSIVKEVGSQASEYGGRKLGPSLGLTDEQSKGGIGKVLGTSLFQALGLEEKKPAGADRTQAAADKLAKAGDAQANAVKLQEHASENLLKASEALMKAAGARGAETNFGSADAAATTSSTRPRGASAAAEATGDWEGKPQVPTPQGSNEGGQAKMAAWLKEHGYSDSAAAGVMGNARVESNFDPNAFSGYYKGMFQWDKSRWAAGGSPQGDFEGQMRLMDKELTQRLPNFKTSDAPAGNLAAQFDKVFEVSAGTSRKARVDMANRYAGLGASTAGNGDFGDSGIQVNELESQPFRGVDPAQQRLNQQGDEKSGSSFSPSEVQSAVEGGIRTGMAPGVDMLQAGDDKVSQALQGVETSDQKLDASIDKNSSAVQTNTEKQGKSGGGGIGDIVSGGAGSASSTKSALSSLSSAASSAGGLLTSLGGNAAIAGRTISTVTSGITQLSSVAKGVSSVFDVVSGGSQAVAAATTIEQGAKTLNAAAFVTDTAAVQAHAATEATSSASSGLGGIGSVIGGLFSIFEQGGIVPSAAGGMVMGSGGSLAILHPREMVLPSHLSTGLQGMIDRGGQGGAGGDLNFNYSTNVTGYHPFGTKSSFESMLRSNSGAMMEWARNEFRNGSFR